MPGAFPDVAHGVVYGQLLRDDRLLQRQLLLELLHRPFPAHQRLHYADARRVRERMEELRP